MEVESQVKLMFIVFHRSGVVMEKSWDFCIADMHSDFDVANSILNDLINLILW